MEASATRIAAVHRVVEAVSEHIATQHAVAGSNHTVCVDESTDLGIVITGLEVVQLCIFRIVLAIAAKTGHVRKSNTAVCFYFLYIKYYKKVFHIATIELLFCCNMRY